MDKQKADLHFIHTYNRSVTFVKGEDVYLYDDTGKKYLDMGAGIKPVLYSFLYGLEQVLLPYEAATILFMYATGYVSLRFFALVMALRFLAGGIVVALSGWWLWPLMEL